jgi:branched-chain amino acid transport system substrate-binding protein
MPSSKIPQSVQFYNKYKQLYGKEIQAGHGPAPAYESVYILAEAIERANSVDPDAIVAELKKTDRMGIMGRIRYNDANQAVFGNDPNETAMGAVIQWGNDGKRRIVYPASIAEAAIQLPAGLKSLK